jgi:hypothetical protein
VTPRPPLSYLVKSPWEESFQRLVSLAERDLLLVSPFVKVQPVERILSILRLRGADRRIRVTAVCNLRPESCLNGSTDVEAFAALKSALPLFQLVHHPSLHAKAYVADDKMAVVTSANLTEPGIRKNLEYGVAFTDRTRVREIRRDLEGYSQLGARIAAADIEALVDETRELKEAFQEAERSIRAAAKRAFHTKLEAAQVRMLQRRASGRTTQGILSDTILFLLSKGPLRTVELHPLIQQMHPDLCDDSVDRVIGGVHFGKRWKHYVRSAQAHLKQAGRIATDGERWHLISSG